MTKQTTLADLNKVGLLRDLKKEFEEQFCYIDTGPDGDGYDAEPIEWEQYFKIKRDDYQIDKIFCFIENAVEKAYEDGSKDAAEKLRTLAIPLSAFATSPISLEEINAHNHALGEAYELLTKTK